ncbi:ATP-dependent DNA helicase 2 subunit KU70-like [Populus trichocarpa]|uniref:ATP-dependent DNA helicase 2 subunit KU70-like n=1 Tax=Populus trichocarpa TaxID=3694 RepID=UPI000D18A32C|nr:ATP-dependent DNA helicase 2 subunit KU70-like [Populus trichocarpa]|eukprot:XP_024449166.1 ATP-dependent DNA helicase 2 subunit KU70-like [Populus trichocarpa]
MPEINEETLPDEEAMARLGVVEAEKFKLPVYGDNDDEESAIGNGKASNASKKRKPVSENTAKESANYNWPNLTDNGHDAFICFKYDGIKS